MKLTLAKTVIGAAFTLWALIYGNQHCDIMLCDFNYIISDPVTLALSVTGFCLLSWAARDICVALVDLPIIFHESGSTPIADADILKPFYADSQHIPYLHFFIPPDSHYVLPGLHFHSDA